MAEPANRTPEDPIDRDDREHARDHKLDRMAPSRRAVWPKSDQRSSARVRPDEGGAPPPG